MRPQTRLDEVSVLSTGCSVFESEASPSMTRPPTIGSPADEAVEAPIAVAAGPGAGGATGAHAPTKNKSPISAVVGFPTRLCIEPLQEPAFLPRVWWAAPSSRGRRQQRGHFACWSGAHIGRWPLSQCPTIEPIVSQAHFGLSWEVSPRISTKAPSSTATERKHEVVGVQIDVLRLPGRGGPTPHEHRYGNDRRTTTRPRMNNRWDDCEGELNFSHKPELR